MKHIFGTALLLALCATLPAVAATHNGGAKMSAQSKMPACGSDTVVYAVPAANAYFLPGNPKYGHMKGGKYMCKTQAIAAGYHGA